MTILPRLTLLRTISRARRGRGSNATFSTKTTKPPRPPLRSIAVTVAGRRMTGGVRRRRSSLRWMGTGTVTTSSAPARGRRAPLDRSAVAVAGLIDESSTGGAGCGGTGFAAYRPGDAASPADATRRERLLRTLHRLAVTRMEEVLQADLSSSSSSRIGGARHYRDVREMVDRELERRRMSRERTGERRRTRGLLDPSKHGERWEGLGVVGGGDTSAVPAVAPSAGATSTPSAPITSRGLTPTASSEPSSEGGGARDGVGGGFGSMLDLLHDDEDDEHDDEAMADGDMSMRNRRSTGTVPPSPPPHPSTAAASDPSDSSAGHGDGSLMDLLLAVEAKHEAETDAEAEAGGAGSKAEGRTATVGLSPSHAGDHDRHLDDDDDDRGGGDRGRPPSMGRSRRRLGGDLMDLLADDDDDDDDDDEYQEGYLRPVGGGVAGSLLELLDEYEASSAASAYTDEKEKEGGGGREDPPPLPASGMRVVDDDDDGGSSLNPRGVGIGGGESSGVGGASSSSGFMDLLREGEEDDDVLDGLLLEGKKDGDVGWGRRGFLGDDAAGGGTASGGGYSSSRSDPEGLAEAWESVFGKGDGAEGEKGDDVVVNDDDDDRDQPGRIARVVEEAIALDGAVPDWHRRSLLAAARREDYSVRGGDGPEEGAQLVDVAAAAAPSDEDEDEDERWFGDDNTSSVEYLDASDLLRHRLGLLGVMVAGTSSTASASVGTTEAGEAMEAACELVDGASKARWVLTTTEFNLLIRAVSLLSGDDAASLLLVFDLMCELAEARVGDVDGDGDGRPDASTYSLLMRALLRGGCVDAAAGVRSHMVRSLAGSPEDPAAALTTTGAAASDVIDADAVRVGIVECLARDDGGGGGGIGGARVLEEVEALLHHGVKGGFPLDRRVFGSAVDLCRRLNDPERARRIMGLCIEELARDDARGVHRIVQRVIDWPRGGRRRGGTFGDVGLGVGEMAYHHGCILDEIEEFERTESYLPNLGVWRRLVLSASASAGRSSRQRSQKLKSSSRGWDVAARACRAMLGDRQMLDNHPPDPFLLKRGWEAAEMTCDPQLAVDLLEWGWQWSNDGGEDDELSELLELEESRSFDAAASDGGEDDSSGDHLIFHSSSDGEARVPSRGVNISSTALFRVLSLCLRTGALDLADDVLACCPTRSTTRMPDPVRSRLYTILVSAHARRGDCEKAREMLHRMQANGPKPSERTYGAVLHALALARRDDEASTLLNSMRHNEFGDGVRPGSSCYSACMLCAMQSGDWEGVLRLNDEMREAKIPSDASSFHAVLLASARLRDRTVGRDALEAAIEEKIPFNREGMQLCMQLFLPGVCDRGSLGETREALRSLESRDAVMASKALRLSKAIRIAEIEDKRGGPNGTNENRSKEIKCWDDIMLGFAELVRDMEVKGQC